MIITRVGETPRKDGGVVLRHGRSRFQNALSDSWQTKVEQLCNVSSPCLDDHQFKQKELESVRELSQVCSQIVLKMLVLGTNWETRHSMVCPQTCKTSYNMDSGLRQTMGQD